MSQLKVLSCFAALALSISANAVTYDCGSLDNPYVSYSIHVDDDLVTLRTVHSSKQGMHAMTNMIMKPVHSDLSAYQAGGLRVRFAPNGITLSDRHGQRVECR